MIRIEKVIKQKYMIYIWSYAGLEEGKQCNIIEGLENKWLDVPLTNLGYNPKCRQRFYVKDNIKQLFKILQELK